MITDKSESLTGCPVRGFFRRAAKSEAARHMRNARKEVLLAVRSVVDAGLERLEAREKAASEEPARKVEIN